MKKIFRLKSTDEVETRMPRPVQGAPVAEQFFDMSATGLPQFMTKML